MEREKSELHSQAEVDESGYSEKQIDLFVDKGTSNKQNLTQDPLKKKSKKIQEGTIFEEKQ